MNKIYYLQILNSYLHWMKRLLKSQSRKSFLASKDKIAQSLDILTDLVKVRAMKYSSNC